jgi:putative transposase
MNPVRVRLVRRGEDWPWSSARAHLTGRVDGLIEVAPLMSRYSGRFANPIAGEPAPALIAAPHAAEPPDRGRGVGRPLGASRFSSGSWR